jgi:hypothetical protein
MRLFRLRQRRRNSEGAKQDQGQQSHAGSVAIGSAVNAFSPNDPSAAESSLPLAPFSIANRPCGEGADAGPTRL